MIDPLASPDTAGLNVTLMVQVPAGASVLGESGQLLVCEKPALATMPEMVKADVPLLVSVIDWRALVIATG